MARPPRNAISLDFIAEVTQDLQTAYLQCPYCGEQIEVRVDCSVGRQEYVEDCSVCCRPIVVSVVASDGEVIRVEGRSEDE